MSLLIRLFLLWILAVAGLVWKAWTPGAPPVHASDSLQVLFLPLTPCRIPPSLEARIREARCCMDLALYNLDFPALERLLIEASRRGVRIRVVTDGRRRNRRAFRRLQRHGIPVVFRPRGGLMHHKFAVVDSLWVITGSANWTRNGICRHANHMVILKHRDIARAYLEEFEEMFQRRRFGTRERAAPLRFLLGATPVEVWFSPDMDVPELLTRRIQQTQETLQVMALTLTDDRIARALIQASRRGVYVAVVAEGHEPQGSDLARLSRVFPVCRDTGAALLHHKSMRMDGWILFGSYNFSRSAARRNDENLLLMRASPELLDLWSRVFQDLSRRAVCTGPSAPS